MEATPSATVRKVVNQEAATETPDSRTYLCSCSPGTKQPGSGNCHRAIPRHLNAESNGHFSIF